ncbi:MAG TPA: hypothetical protein VME21_06555 [Steroidobacteraceae bacterium]|nr:hypothetical protein [Steroidobacteraceae bacterium]
MAKWLLLIVLVALLGVSGFSYLALHWSYATGDRAGYVQKFSRKGWVCKTWEGEMAMVTLPGTLAEKFYFTVPSAPVAARINASLGHRVVLHYEQHKWLPSSCFGDTEYYVVDLRTMD